RGSAGGRRRRRNYRPHPGRRSRTGRDRLSRRIEAAAGSVKRLLAYRPAAQRELNRMDRSDAERVVRALEGFAVSGLGDVKALKGALKGRYRLRVTDVDNRGQAY